MKDEQSKLSKYMDRPNPRRALSSNRELELMEYMKFYRLKKVEVLLSNGRKGFVFARLEP